MAPSKTFNLAGLAFSNIIIRDPALRNRFKDRDKLFGMVPPCLSPPRKPPMNAAARGTRL